MQVCLVIATPWTVARQAPLSMGFSRQAYLCCCCHVHCHALLQGSSRPRDGTHISCVSCIAGGFFTTSATWEAPWDILLVIQVIHIYAYVTAAAHASLHLVPQSSPSYNHGKISWYFLSCSVSFFYTIDSNPLNWLHEPPRDSRGSAPPGFSSSPTLSWECQAWEARWCNVKRIWKPRLFCKISWL